MSLKKYKSGWQLLNGMPLVWVENEPKKEFAIGVLCPLIVDAMAVVDVVSNGRPCPCKPSSVIIGRVGRD